MKGRVVASFLMFFCVLALIPSGIMLHASSSEASERTRHLLMSIHNISAIILVISALVHLAFNFKTMISYLRSRPAVSTRPRRGAMVALMIFLILLGAAILHGLH